MSDISFAPPAPPAASAVSWPAIFAGAVVAMAVTLIFAALGAGFSAGALAAWPNTGHGLTTFTAVTGAWMIVTQWVSAGVGGYLTGRLRTRWHALHTHEVFFRDTANGFIMWAVATLIVAALGALVANQAAPVAAATASTQSAADVAAAAKAAAGYAVFSAIGLLVGAFVACVGAALGGQQRDEHP